MICRVHSPTHCSEPTSALPRQSWTYRARSTRRSAITPERGQMPGQPHRIRFATRQPAPGKSSSDGVGTVSATPQTLGTHRRSPEVDARRGQNDHRGPPLIRRPSSGAHASTVHRPSAARDRGSERTQRHVTYDVSEGRPGARSHAARSRRASDRSLRRRGHRTSREPCRSVLPCRAACTQSQRYGSRSQHQCR